MTRLTIQHASVGYPGRPVLREVSFSLTSGSVCCLLGANGSGKTTLMRSILRAPSPALWSDSDRQHRHRTNDPS